MTLFASISLISNPLKGSNSRISSSNGSGILMRSNSVSCGGCGGTTTTIKSSGSYTIDSSINVYVDSKNVYSRTYHDSFNGCSTSISSISSSISSSKSSIALFGNGTSMGSNSIACGGGCGSGNGFGGIFIGANIDLTGGASTSSGGRGGRPGRGHGGPHGHGRGGSGSGSSCGCN
ncbi:hypothetical protein ACTFIR_000106 [Dictyostelium discoideum]